MLTVYKASAGSGKTFNLVYEYVKVLLGVKDRRSDTGGYLLNSDKYCPARQPNRHRGILAITFTNAATKEMKDRVVEALVGIIDSFGNGDDTRQTHPYIERLTADYGCLDKELLDAAALALKELLNDYSNFRISTIDSFSQSVLRAFSRELNRQVDYDIELDTESSLRESVTDMLEEIKIPRPGDTNATHLRRWIERFATSRREKGAAFNFFNTGSGLLDNLTSNLEKALDETYNNYADELDRYLDNPDTIGEFQDALGSYAETVLVPVKKDASALLAAAKELTDPKAVLRLYERARQVMKNISVNPDIAIIQKADTAEDKEFVTGTKMKACGLRLEDLSECIEASRRFALTLRDVYPSLLERQKIVGELMKSAEVMEFFGHARRKQLDFLRENNTMLIADTNRLLKEIIDGAEAPFIYERLGEQIHTILIDEFQDTSRLQWNNLAPLVRNSLAEGFDNLIIGDVKQSIYRFRSTDSRLLGSEVEADTSLAPVISRGTAVEDSTNRRSAWPVVRTNNSIFRRLPGLVDRQLGTDRGDGPSAAGIYGDVVQAPDARLKDRTGYVRINFSPDPDCTDSSSPNLERMVRDIRRQHDEGGYNWRDILILARSNQEGTVIVNYLKDNGIPVLSAVSLLLNSSPAVRTVISLMKLVRTYYDPASAVIDMDQPSYSPTRITMLGTRFNYYVAQGDEPVKALDKALKNDISDDLRDKILKIRSQNPANIVALIDAIIKEELNDEQRSSEFAYLAALQDIALRYADSPDTSLGHFLNDYDANIGKWTIKPGADQDAVEVLTIHKSKGLERACVHIPACSWPLRPKSKSIWLETEKLKKWLGQTVSDRPDWESLAPPIMWFYRVTPDSVLTSAASPFAQRLGNEFLLDVLDSLNVTYVAFTRAARELIVSATNDPDGKGNPEKSIPVNSLLLQAITEQAGDGDSRCIDLAGNFDMERMEFTAGEPTVKLTSEKDRRKDREEKERWQESKIELDMYPVELDNENARKLFTIDDTFADRIPETEEERQPVVTDATVEGIHFHEIMSRIRVIDDLDGAVGDYCRKNGLDPGHFGAPLRKAFDESDDKALITSWFTPGNDIFLEAEIYDYSINRLLRPDRVVVMPDGSATVVDYKFPEPGEDISRSLPQYLRQVAVYKRALWDLGYKKVRGYIWYPRENKVIEVKKQTK